MGPKLRYTAVPALTSLSYACQLHVMMGIHHLTAEYLSVPPIGLDVIFAVSKAKKAWRSRKRVTQAT